MPVVIETPISFTAPPHKLWTREECDALTRTGLLNPERYELIDGELILKSGKSLAHVIAATLIVTWLRNLYGVLYVAQEAPIDVSPLDVPTSEPEPDVYVTNRSLREIEGRPIADDLRLIAEVSNSTLAFDLTVKMRLYARAGIPEYWVLDLESRRLIVHRLPENGMYREVVGYAEDESVATLAAPETTIRVGELL